MRATETAVRIRLRRGNDCYGDVLATPTDSCCCIGGGDCWVQTHAVNSAVIHCHARHPDKHTQPECLCAIVKFAKQPTGFPVTVWAVLKLHRCFMFVYIRG